MTTTKNAAHGPTPCPPSTGEGSLKQQWIDHINAIDARNAMGDTRRIYE